MQNQTDAAAPTKDWRRDDAALERARVQLQAYFAGELRDFDLPLAAPGTPFQQRVWLALCDIRYGENHQLRRAGAAYRPTGRLARGGPGQRPKPDSIVVPCHRVIGANGSLTGYGGGLERKRWLARARKQGQPDLRGCGMALSSFEMRPTLGCADDPVARHYELKEPL